MTPEEWTDAQRLSRVIRASRKVLGMTQADLSTEIGVKQGTLSKIESGFLILSSTQWFRFCYLMRIDPRETYESGLIDTWVADSQVYEASGQELLPSHYRWSAESRVRALRPWVDWAIQSMGIEEFESFCVSRRVDPDIFSVLPARMSIEFIVDLIDHYGKQHSLSKKLITEIAGSAATPVVHGPAYAAYRETSDVLAALTKLISNASRYETNFDYSIESANTKKIVIEAVPRTHLRDILGKTAQFSDAWSHLDQYRAQYWSGFLDRVLGVDSKVVIRESMLTDASASRKRCLYELNLTKVS